MRATTVRVTIVRVTTVYANIMNGHAAGRAVGVSMGGASVCRMRTRRRQGRWRVPTRDCVVATVLGCLQCTAGCD